MVNWKRVGALGLAAAIGSSGCATMEARKWDGCAAGGGVIGAVLGGTGAGVGVSEGVNDASSEEIAGAAAGGAVVGGALGAVLGHLICDPEKETPPPPPPPPAPPPSKKVETFQSPFFDFNKYTLRPLGQQKCDHAAGLLKGETGKVIITGYTDSIGSDAYNLKLGQRRAESVKQCLVDRGIPATRIITKSKGKADPVASNATEEGRQANRRVEIERE